MEKLFDRLKIKKDFEKLMGKDVIIVFEKSASSYDGTPLLGKVTRVDEAKASIDTKGFVSLGGSGGIGQIEIISFDEVEEVTPF